MDECPFCADSTIQDRFILRDNEYAWAFPTNIPIVPMHTLVAPIRHIATFNELTKEEHAAVFDILARLTRVFRETFGAEGFNIAWNEGPVAGQSIAHLHLHVLPRKESDTGITEYDPRKFLYRPGSRAKTPEDELRAVAETIRAALAK